MGIFEKLKFWERGNAGNDFMKSIPTPGTPGKGNAPFQDDLGLGMDTSLTGTQDPLMAAQPMPRMDAFGQRQYAQQPQMQMPSYYQTAGSNKDLEIVSAKLDALKATLENISQRLANIERIAYAEEDTTRKRGW